jgi:hypothetical protein
MHTLLELRYQINTNHCRERIVVEFFPRARAARAPACRRKFTKIYEIPRARATRAPCAEKVSMSEMAASASWLAHERPRVTQKFHEKFPSGVIHQKLRLELIQHSGYLASHYSYGLTLCIYAFFDGSR